MDVYIFKDTGIRETNMVAVLERIKRTFTDRLYNRNIKRSIRANWLDISISEAFNKIINFLETL